MMADLSQPGVSKNKSLWRLKVGIATLIFCLSVSAVPIYNKLVFAEGVCDGKACLRKYPYPMATAFLQLSLVSLVLTFANICGHVWDRSAASWIFGEHMQYKLRHIGPVGILFGLKYGVTNWGLQMIPVGMHLLLQSTDIIWTIFLAEFVNGEDLGLVEVLAALLSAAGSFLIGLHAVDTIQAPLVPVLVNLLPPFILALCVSTLRMGAQELFRPDNEKTQGMSVVEFTAIKLCLSSITALSLAMLCETRQHNWWGALMEESNAGILLMLLGAVFVLIFQVNLTWLAGLTSVATVGIIGGVKIIPQWIINALFQQVDLEPLNLLGACLILAACLFYSLGSSGASKLVIRWSNQIRHPKIFLRWKPRRAPGLPSDMWTSCSFLSEQFLLDVPTTHK
ncbi:unnamed protein product [Durusdinium trenchii]|uniref:EamA domain-containing protein n=1 Tax=Durusdinium trenchii TaxID=1381693 RepID=A0ABP0MTN2_9DINO